MTSINSSSNFFTTLKNNFRRYLAPFVSFQIISFFVSAFTISVQYNYITGISEDITEDFAGSNISLFVFFCVVQLFVLVGLMFKGIYSKRASDYYFSLPVKRSTWFNANFVFGILSAAVSYAIFYISSVVAFKLHIIKAIENFDFNAILFLKYILMSFAAVLVIYTIFIMCAVVSGRKWQYILLSFISTAVLSLGAIGFISYLNTIYGAWINLYEAYTVSSLILAFRDLTEFPVYKFIIAAVLQFAVAYTVGLVVFKRRKAEIAENKLAGKIIPAVLVTLCFLSEIVVCLGISDIALSSRIISAIIIAVVTALILSAIFFRKAVSKPVLASLLCAVVISGAAMLFVQIVPEKTFVNYVPESSEVETVTLNDCGIIVSPSITDILYGISYLETDSTLYTYTFSTDEGKDKVNQLHEKIVSKKPKVINSPNDYFYGEFRTIEFEYKLKNGRTVKRTYTVSVYNIYEDYVSLLQTDEGFNQLEDFSLNEDNIIFAEVVYDEETFDDYVNFGTKTDDISAHVDDYKKLYQCIRKDYQKASAKSFAFYNLSSSYFDYEDYENSDGFIEISISTLNDNMAEEHKEKVKKMKSYDEIEDYETACFVKQDNMEAIFFNHVYRISYEDENTISYLKEFGYKFK